LLDNGSGYSHAWCRDNLLTQDEPRSYFVGLGLSKAQPAAGTLDRAPVGLTHFALLYGSDRDISMNVGECLDVAIPMSNLVDHEHGLDKRGVRGSGSDAARDKTSGNGCVVGNTNESVRFQEWGIGSESFKCVIHDRGNRTKLLLVELNRNGIVVSAIDTTCPAIGSQGGHDGVKIVEVVSKAFTNTGDGHLQVLRARKDRSNCRDSRRRTVKSLDQSTGNVTLSDTALPEFVKNGRNNSMQCVMSDDFPAETGIVFALETLLPKIDILGLHFLKVMVTAHAKHVGDCTDHVSEVLTEFLPVRITESDTVQNSISSMFSDGGHLLGSETFCFVVLDMETVSGKSRRHKTETGGEQTNVGDLVMVNVRGNAAGSSQIADIESNEGSGLGGGEGNNSMRDIRGWGVWGKGDNTMRLTGFDFSDFSGDETFTVEVVVVDPIEVKGHDDFEEFVVVVVGAEAEKTEK
jgi:hypothetical protein